MRTRTSRIAIVCQPWDIVAPQTGSSIVLIAYQLARHLGRHWYITLYGRRGPGQKHRQIDEESVEFKRVKVFRKPQAIIEVLFSILSCYYKIPIFYMFSRVYHLFYALRVAISIRLSRHDHVLVFNFLQFASMIRFFNRSATICLYMQCAWLTQFATAANERRLRKVDLVIGCSDYITEAIKSRFPTIAGRCQTVYNGVDATRFCPLSGVPPRDPQRLLFLARVSPEKGVHVLIQAFKILTESRPALRLDIVGHPGIMPYIYLVPDPDDRAIASLEPFYGNHAFDMVRRQLLLRGEAYLADLGATAAGDDQIIFHRAVLQTDTIDFYRQAAMLVSPSVWHEPFGIPVVEAMACGLPVVSTYSGGIPEIVEHRRTGVLVSRGDAEALAQAIGELIDNPALAHAMGEAGRQRVLERFTWEASARRLANLIESVSGARRKSGVVGLGRTPNSSAEG